MSKFNNSLLSSKGWLSMFALYSIFALSACQTTPQIASDPIITPNNSTVIIKPNTNTNIVVEQNDNTYKQYPAENYPIEDNSADNDIAKADTSAEYPIEPYIPSNQASIITSDPVQPSSKVSEPIYNTQYEQVVEFDDQDIDERANSTSITKAPIISQVPTMPSRNELLERARQNSQQQARQPVSDNNSLPAFRNLMEVGINQLKSGQLTAAENSFTRAQRLAPKSSAVYFYLAQVALKKNQPRKAEAMARRGLVVSKDTSRRQALWQIILQSGQAQGNSRVVNEAKQALR